MTDQHDTEDTHGETWGEAVDETIAEAAARLEMLTETEDELESAIETTGSAEATILKSVLEIVRIEREELQEATLSLIEQRETDPFERLSDEQIDTLREMYGPAIPRGTDDG